jgi:hypothetical protein
MIEACETCGNLDPRFPVPMNLRWPRQLAATQFHEISTVETRAETTLSPLRILFILSSETVNGGSDPVVEVPRVIASLRPKFVWTRRPGSRSTNDSAEIACQR